MRQPDWDLGCFDAVSCGRRCGKGMHRGNGVSIELKWFVRDAC